MKGKYGAILTLGFALFAMFFGAGNLILPPYIGLISGDKWGVAVIGFFLTAILAPFLGILAVVMSGKSFTNLRAYLPEKIGILIQLLIILCIGPLIAIPRTGATTFEVGIQPIFSNFNNILFAVIFFTIVAFLSISPGKIVDVIGKYLTPTLIISLFILIIWGVAHPVISPEKIALTNKEVFKNSFLDGYQTLDVLAAVIFAGIIISTAVEKGFTAISQRIKATIFAGVIAMMALLFIYGGLLYLGAISGYPLNEETSRTALLLYISQSIFGVKGAYVVSVAMSLACLTTAIALTSATASFFQELTCGKMDYKLNVILCCVVSGFFSIMSVDEIIAYAINILLFIYPIVFSLIILVVIFSKKVKNKKPYLAGIIATAVISFLGILENLGYGVSIFIEVKNIIPLSSYSLEWLVPSLFAFVVTALVCGRKREIA
ncbi:branched-chain amino acid transport system II carrier protein [Weeksellaceae bacterium TAE3-ERU29]|nr:branched-chain amino acid transport system II carrier protein [Weeksellaceae bacterium TAE3-ERU29]